MDTSNVGQPHLEGSTKGKTPDLMSNMVPQSAFPLAPRQPRKLPPELPLSIANLIESYDRLHEMKVAYLLGRLAPARSKNSRWLMGGPEGEGGPEHEGGEHEGGEHGSSHDAVDKNMNEAAEKLSHGDIKGAVESEKKALDSIP